MEFFLSILIIIIISIAIIIYKFIKNAKVLKKINDEIYKEELNKTPNL